MAITLDPNFGSNAGQTAVTITGDGGSLAGTSSVRFGGVPATIVGTPTTTEVTVLSPVGVSAVGVTVTTPGGTSLPVTYYYVPLPVLRGVSPTCGPVTGATSVTITGQYLSTVTAVRFGSVSVSRSSFTAQSAAAIMLPVPAQSGAGAKTVVVASPVGDVGALAFTYCAVVAAANVILTPNTGTTLGNTVVAITVSQGGLGCIKGVTIGGNAVRSLCPVSDTQVTVVTPAGTLGAKNVVITTCAGTTTLTNGFTYALL